MPLVFYNYLFPGPAENKGDPSPQVLAWAMRQGHDIAFVSITSKLSDKLIDA